MNTQNTQNSILFQWSSSRNSKRIYTAKKQLYPNHHKPPQPNSTFDYAQMTRQQRRAYERRLAKENKRKY